MQRILQVGDFIPDFSFSNAEKRCHSAALGGQKWILIVLRCSAHFYEYPELQKLVRESPAASPTLKLIALSPSNAASVDSDAQILLHSSGSSNLLRIFFDDRERDRTVCCMIIDHGQKIARRIDCHPREVPEVARNFLRECQPAPATDIITPIPVLKVPSALSETFCRDLIKYYRESQQKVQGRAGLSSPVLDYGVKRVVHVNTEPELGRAIDRIFMFSLLPAVERVFDFRVTHRVTYKVSLYSGQKKGFFAAHRDNSDVGTLFRRYALSVCLNEDWKGGGIIFPEYSSSALSLATGDALVFPVSLMHRVNPIQQGERFVLLSFMYDEHGARARRAGMDNPAILDEKYIDAIDGETLSAYNQFSPVSRFSPQYTR